MSTTADVMTGTALPDTGVAALPVSPFYGVRYHFGMLLGVDDFETAEAYARGKTWLHNAWLHRAGVVWGFGVKVVEARGEIEVAPGLALDAAGHELHLDRPFCVNLGAWYEAHKNDPGFESEPTEGGVRFNAHVTVRFRACLARPVPAMTEPCEGAESDTAFSRTTEAVQLDLVPGLAPDPGPPPYRRLRILFGVLDPDPASPADAEVVTERNRIIGLPADDQPKELLEAFRRFAALDEIDLAPAADASDSDGSPLYPATDAPPVVLADVTGIELQQTDTGWRLTAGGTVNTQVRPSHVATATIQELLCGRLLGAAAPAFALRSESDAAPPAGSATADAGGPRVDPASVHWRGEAISFDVDRVLLTASADPRAVSVTAFDTADGWTDVDIASVEYKDKRVTIALRHAPRGSRVRLIARGTGPFPFLGRTYVPLAGGPDAPPGSIHDGHDFVIMLTARS